jgi:6-pyruvoyltetrahydropterin/6-carboxytetrahydropterin synthase
MAAEAAPMRISLTRRYGFSASHRLHSPAFSDEENWQLYGKCNNPYGHGHNYFVEVTVTGPVEPSTGMIANLGDLDAFVKERVIEPFQYSFLNAEAAAFARVVPTTENLCVEVYNRLKDFPKARVERIRIEETGLNSFEYIHEALSTPEGTAGS